MSLSILTEKNVYKYLAKGVGITALGFIAHDSHILGKIQADTYSNVKDANITAKRYTDTMQLSNPSDTLDGMKKSVLRFEMNSNWRRFFNSAIGYLKGFTSMLVNEVIPLTLGTAALFGKDVLSKGSAIGLAGYALLTFLKDGLGLGHKNPLNK